MTSGPVVVMVLEGDKAIVKWRELMGATDPAKASAEMQHASDSKHCRRCGAAYEYEGIYLGHLGVYSCPSCGQRRPQPDVSARAIELHGTRSSSFELHTPAGVVAGSPEL